MNAEEQKLLEAGRVGRAHGLDGSFYVTGPVPRLLDLHTLTVQGQHRKVVRRSGTKQRPILRLEGMACRQDAEALRGQALLVDSGEAPALGEGEYWSHELEGCEVIDGERYIGAIRDLIGLPSCEALLVDCVEGGELLVPMVREAIRRVDLANKRVEIDLEFLGLS